MRKVEAVLIASILVSLQGCVMEGGIVGDVRALRKVNRRIEVDISDIARKHIVVGQKREVVEQYFMERNFKINYVPIAADEKKAIIAVYVVKSSRNILGFHDEVRVIVDFKSDVVSSISGRLIYRMS